GKHSTISSNFVKAGLFSADLTSFLIDKTHDLRRSRWSSTSNRMLHYSLRSPSKFPLSHHRSPSHPPPSYVFILNPSNVRVNVFWFMNLFSISAALFATLVQQWVRNY
ncbi:hypothetical protein EDB92DRAFT_1777941, partial [Lactarius akahatsu]